MAAIRFIKLLFLIVFIGIISHAKAAMSQQLSEFAGSETCSTCHQEEFESWQKSDHGWAWLPATEKSVLGNFENAEFTHQGITTRFFKRDGKYWIETETTDDALVNYEIKYTVGIEPLQQYLIETEGGRLQTLDIAWDTEAKKWFMVFPDHQNNVPGNALHWTGVYKNWNGRCAECHATGYDKGYDPVKNSFDSKWAEIGVGCESCHGPAARHVALAEQGQPQDADPTKQLREYLELPNTGLSQTTVPANQSQEIAVCASCHSRRTPLTAKSSPHGSNFDEYYDLAPLRADLYFPDGQIIDEVYVLGSFYQSKMYEAGVQCSDCHNAHTTKIKVEGNGLCAQCHNPDGNIRFPTLRKAEYDNFEHMRHEPGTLGGQCVDCHMPERTYMEVDPRRDHRFGIPSPQDTVDIGTPNACTSCHTDKNAEWAIEQLATWRPDRPQPASKFGKIFHRLNTEPEHPDNISDLMGLIEDEHLPAIVRATAIERLTPYAQELDWATFQPFRRQEPAIVRVAAVRLFANAPPEQRLPVLSRALTDEARSVRIAGARGLLGVPTEQMPENLRQPMQKASQEFMVSLRAHADHPNTRLGMAGVALSIRNTEAALASVDAALKIDPQLTDAWIMRARIQHSMMRPDLVEKTMVTAESNVPDSPQLLNFFGNYLFGQRRTADAGARLSRAYSLSDENPIYGMDYAQFLLATQKPDKALDILHEVLVRTPDDIGAMMLLARAYAANNQPEKHEQTINKIRKIAPDLEIPLNLLNQNSPEVEKSE